MSYILQLELTFQATSCRHIFLVSNEVTQSANQTSEKHTEQQATTKLEQPFRLTTPHSISIKRKTNATAQRLGSHCKRGCVAITLPSKSKSSHIKIKIKIKKKHGFRSVLISNCQYSRPPLDTARNTSTDARQRRLFVSSVL